MRTKKQIAAQQLRSIRAIKDRIERLACGFGDVDQYMVGEAEALLDAARTYEEALNEMMQEET